jgi:uncharacterized membrane protein
MNKSRIESFSDGVFSIVMTLLVFNIRVPVVLGEVTDIELWGMLVQLAPLIGSFILSFLVLAVFWINHNFLFHTILKTADRYINLMNMLYLLFLVFVPFSANLLGTYPLNKPAVLIYGFNILAVITMSLLMVGHILKNPEIHNKISKRQSQQAGIRTRLTFYSYVIGIVCAFVYIPISIFFYLFPLLFNIIPGTLNFAEK